MKEEKLNLKQALEKLTTYGVKVTAPDGTVMDAEKALNVPNPEEYKIDVNSDINPCCPASTMNKLSEEDQRALDDYTRNAALALVRKLRRSIALTKDSGDLVSGIQCMLMQVFVTAAAASRLTDLWFENKKGQN